MCARMRTCLLLSAAAHLAVLVWTGSERTQAFDDRGVTLSTANVMMTEWIDASKDVREAVPEAVPEPAPASRAMEASVETPPSTEAEEPERARPEPALPVPSRPAASGGGPDGEIVPGKRLNMDLSRIAWVQGVMERSSRYQRNAPKGFEGMVRSALSQHPSNAEGSARISMKFDPSGTVKGVDIRSDSPELKTALARVGWEAGPLPSRYRIPCSGLNVNVTVTGSNLFVGIELI